MRNWIKIPLAGLACAGAIALMIFAQYRQKPSTSPTVTYHSLSAPETSADTSVSFAASSTVSQVTTHSESSTTRQKCQDINSATLDDLLLINGIGSSTAQAILSKRDELGGFRKRSDLLAVSGIGEMLADRILEIYPILNPEPEETVTEVLTVAVTDTASETTQIRRFDLNLVTKDELLTIPQMDDETADEILQLRTDIQQFRNIRELALLPDLSDRYILDVLSEWLYVESE